MLNTDDSVLVGMLCEGRMDAFEEIDRRYRSKLCRFLGRWTVDIQHAEDIAQMTLFRAYQTIRTLNTGEKFAAWIYRIARNLAIDESRKHRPVPLEEKTEIVDSRIGPSEQLLEREEMLNLWTTAKNHLTDDEYTAIWLRYADSRKVDSIASIMEKSPGSIRVLLCRARKKLLPHLSE